MKQLSARATPIASPISNFIEKNMEFFPRSNAEQIDPGLLPTVVKEIKLEEYLQLIAAVALVYDSVITIDGEAKHFWRVPRRPVDFVYFANRFIGILGAVASLFYYTLLMDIEECNFVVWTQDIANWITFVLVDYVLTIRVLALYSRDRTLSICLYLFLALEATAKLTMMVYGIVFEKIAVGGADRISICGADRIPPWQLGIADWSVQPAYGIILMALALYKAAEYWKLSSGFEGFTLVKVLIEDQVIYFMAVILVSVFAMLNFKLATSNLIASHVLNVLSNPSFLCILGSRMLLNLKEAGERGQNEGTSFVAPSRTVSDIEFGQPPANVEASQTEEVIGE